MRLLIWLGQFVVFVVMIALAPLIVAALVLFVLSLKD